MRVWLIEEEHCEGTCFSLESRLRGRAPQPLFGLTLVGVSSLRPDLPEVLKAGALQAVIVNAESWPEERDPGKVPALGLPTLVLGEWSRLEAWFPLVESHPFGLLPLTAGAAEIWTTLFCLLAAQRREHVLREQMRVLEQRLSDRIIIEKAKGILMAKLRIGEEEAYKGLRVQSRRQRKPIREIAQSILDAQFLLDASSYEHDRESAAGTISLRKQRLTIDPSTVPQRGTAE